MIHLSHFLRILPGFLFIAATHMACEAQAQIPPAAEPGRALQQLQQRPDEPKAGKSTVAVPDMPVPKGGDTTKAFTLQQVVVDGATVYTADQLSAHYKDFVGKKVSLADLNEIARRITAQYRNDGYVLSRAVVGEQKITGGVVHIRVIEGYINDIRINGDLRDSRGIIQDYAAKIKNSRPLNAKDMERYLLLIDDLPGVTAKSVIQASSVKGASDLVITVQHNPVEGDVQFDNRGSRYFGPMRGAATAAFNSPFSLYDRTTVRGLATLNWDELRFGEIIHEEQLGREGTRLLFHGAVTQTEPGSALEPLDIEGESELLEVSLLHPLVRGRQYNVNLKGGFTWLEDDTDVLGADFSNDRISYLSAGTAVDFTDDLRGVNRIDLDIFKGLDVLGATNEGAGRTRINGDQEFFKANLTVSRVQDVTEHVSVLLSASGQYAADALLASQEFGLGGPGFGRAYDSSEISGDDGLGGLVELRYGRDVENTVIHSYQAYAFYDVGAVWNQGSVVGDPAKQTLASTGLGVRFNLFHDLSGYTEVAFPLTRDVAAEGSGGEEPRFFFSLAKRF